MDGLLVEGLLQQMLKERNVQLTFNPALRAWESPRPDDTAQKGQIQRPGQVPNIVFQNRAAEPTPYENALGDGLEQVLENGAETLAQIAEGLNGANVFGPDGQAWTEASLAAELHRLGE